MKLLERSRANQPSFVVPLFRPRVWEKCEEPINAVGWELFNKREGIIGMDPDILNRIFLDLDQELCHTIDEGFTPDEPDIRIGKRLF